MSKSKGNKPEVKSEREEFFDAVFGPDEEITVEAARDILGTYGVTGEQLVNNFKKRLQDRIKRVTDETGTIPKSLEAMLKNVREYQKEKAPKAIDAEKWVADIFSNTSVPSSQSTPLYDLRNRAAGEVSEKDRQILNEITTELEDCGE